MAERRSTRTKRRPDDEEFAEIADDELADEPEDEFADEPDEEDSGRASRNDGRGARRRSSRGQGNRLNAAKAGQAALGQITQLTGKQPEGVTGVDRGEDGWVVGVEVVEDRRVPSSSDILAIYEIELDMDGDLMSYRRVRRYARGRGDDEGF